MIWGDPWTEVATLKSDAGLFCTTLPPPRTPLPDGVRFGIIERPEKPEKPEKPGQEWLDFVKTRWTSEEAALRLTDAVIPCLYDGDTLVATCVLRYRDVWILETLRAKKGWGALFLRAVIPWIWSQGGPFIMAYTWELSLPALVGAWWRGWLRSAAEIQYGWSWIGAGESCGFCPDYGWEPIGPRLAMPALFTSEEGSAVISDSGLVDGWGHVLAYRDDPDWSAVAKNGGWRRLWMRRSVSPGPGWSWTGEFVVVGLLNYNCGPRPSLDWITAEI